MAVLCLWQLNRRPTSADDCGSPQGNLRAVESERNRKRRELYDAQDAIDRDRDELIAKIEKQLSMEQMLQSLYTIRWKLT